MKIIALTLLATLPLLMAAGHDLETKYLFRATLLNDVDNQGELLYYALYWNFSIAEETVHFAVNVSTNGWVGFGVSPNGQMPGSDVVMGWVAEDGTTYFHDRFADTRALPPIDESQDWFLISGEEGNGFTILEFSRNWTTCDDRDLNIGADTARVVWSYQANDPTDPLGNTATFHDRMGSTSLNLLGGLTNPPPDPDDVMSFVVGVSDITIPSNEGTTYWCASAQLPQDVVTQEKYITRISPVITPNMRTYVHHMLVYLCTDPLNPANVGESGPCHTVSDAVSDCRGGLLIGAWAVGGEDFIYPENVAYPVGGPNSEIHTVIEMHYDNPDLDAGVMDSSGMRFYYTSTPRQHRAGIMFFGHRVTPFMIIPPHANNYTVAGVCANTCTNSYLPEDGIHIFGDVLHTHLAGHGLTVRHLRWTEECGGYEELQPIDQNLRYNFNYQQINHLPRELVVLPNDTLILECFYNSMDRTTIITGGESTHEEMCLSFLVYYPRLEGRALDQCVSSATTQSAGPFLQKYGASNPEAYELLRNGQIIEGLNRFDWTQPNIVQDLEDSVLHSSIQTMCHSESGDRMMSQINGLPEVRCPYRPCDKCSTGCLTETTPSSATTHVLSQASIVISILVLMLGVY